MARLIETEWPMAGSPLSNPAPNVVRKDCRRKASDQFSVGSGQRQSRTARVARYSEVLMMVGMSALMKP